MWRRKICPVCLGFLFRLPILDEVVLRDFKKRDMGERDESLPSIKLHALGVQISTTLWWTPMLLEMKWQLYVDHSHVPVASPTSPLDLFTMDQLQTEPCLQGCVPLLLQSSRTRTLQTFIDVWVREGDAGRQHKERSCMCSGFVSPALKASAVSSTAVRPQGRLVFVQQA